MNERDEKELLAEQYAENVAMKSPTQGRFQDAVDDYMEGWDAALESEAVRKLVESLNNIADLNTGEIYDSHAQGYYGLAKYANQALAEFEKARSGK